MRRLYAIVFICLIFIITGCTEKVNSPQPKDEEIIIQADFSEKINELATEYTISSYEEYEEQSTDMVDPIVTELVDSCDVYSVTILWSDMFNTGSADLDTIDWSGTLTVHNGEGYIFVRCMIDFEPGEDSVLIHDNPMFAMWISKTFMDFDGLSFLVFMKWRDTNADYLSQSLWYETEYFNLQFSIAQLAYMTVYHPVENVGGVLIHSRRIWQNTCPGGLIQGTWTKSGNFTDSGSFAGYWTDHLGEPIGYLNGIYWKDYSNDAYVGQLMGSVSGIVTDEVIAELTGYWIYDDPRMCPMCGEGHGLFWGVFTNISDDRQGRFEGEFGDYSLPPDDIEMPMTGIWYYQCPWTSVNNADR